MMYKGLHTDFHCISITRRGMAKWTAGFDSAPQIGLSTCLEDVLIVVGGSSSLNLKISEIGHVSIYISTTRGAMAKMDDAIRFSASNRSIHVHGRRSNCSWGSSSLDFKKQRNRGRFHQYLHNKRRYDKTDGRIGFSALNRSIHVHGRRSNCSWGLFIAAFQKTVKLVTFQFISPQPEPLQQNGWQHWIKHIK